MFACVNYSAKKMLLSQSLASSALMVSDLHNVLNEDKSGAGMVEINLLQSIRLRKSDVQCLAAANFKLNNQDSELKTWSL